MLRSDCIPVHIITLLVERAEIPCCQSGSVCDYEHTLSFEYNFEISKAYNTSMYLYYYFGKIFWI